MRMRPPRKLCRAALPFAAGILVPLAPANGQALHPMRAEITAYGGEFALSLMPRNPGQAPMMVEIRLYDASFRPIAAHVSPSRVLLGGGQARRVIAIVPFAGGSTRYVRACAEAVPRRGTLGTMIRTRVCGKFKGTRR